MDTFGVEAAGLPSRSPPTGSVTVCGEAAPEAFDAEKYKERNAVERCIARLRRWRGLALRTDELAITYQAALHVASILIRSGAEQVAGP